MNTLILPVHKVRVDRGRAQISTEAADHEIAVLTAVHGAGAVNIIERDIGDRDYAASSEIEYNRLRRVYDNRNDQPVGRVFPTHYDLGRFGFDTRAGVGNDNIDSSGAVNIERRPARRLGAEPAEAPTAADSFAYARDAAGPVDAEPAADAAPLGEAETKPDDAPSDGAPEKPVKAAKAK